MGLLDNFERGLERAVNGAFAKTFRSGVQPVEISSALRRELDTKAAVVSRERILVPNELTVRLAPPDFTRMNDVGRPLIDELTQMVHQHAVAQNYSFSGPVTIRLQQDGTLSTGILQVDSTTVQRDVAWIPVLDIGSQRHRLHRGRTVIGRGSDADITIADTGTSRKHVEVLWDGKHAQATDLGSTNGSKLNGQHFQQAIVEPDSTIEIGRTRMVFRVIPENDGGAR
ncbi:FhaA domain-containing protein [Curtobacterium flaccumfaciens pv. flaccumfaciens]|uniref:FhaA domain-containing protein n=1 Tax=Curtobacterium flaccumfaciens TaxID=2035 RepID=UPI003A4E2531